MATDIAVHFCDPQSRWRRLTRTLQFSKVARQLNERPRKTLDVDIPAERFSRCVASTRCTRSPVRTLALTQAAWLNVS
jgi:IS30 family transposase